MVSRSRFQILSPTQIGWFPGVVSDWFPTGFLSLFEVLNSRLECFPPNKSAGFLEWFPIGFRLVSVLFQIFSPTQIGWFPGVVSDWLLPGRLPVSRVFSHTNRVVSWSGFRLVSDWFPSYFKSFPPHKSGGFLLVSLLFEFLPPQI